MINFYLAAFLADLALGAVLLSLPLLLIYRFDATSLTLGLFGALGAFTYSSGVVAAGSLADRHDRKKILISGCVLFILTYLAIPFLKHLGLLFLFYAFGSMSMCMFWPTIQSWLSQGLNKQRLVKSLTAFNICWSAGLTIGFLLAGFLFSFHIIAPFVFGVSLIGIIILLLLRQPVSSEMKEEEVRKVFFETERDRPESAETFLYLAWCANFVSWYIIGTVRNLFPKLGTEIGFSSEKIGMFIFLMVFAQTIMFFILGNTYRWHYRLSPIILFQGFAVIGLLILTFSSRSYHLITAMVFLGISSGMTYFSSIFYSLYGFIDKGKRSGFHEAFIGSGALFGPFVGGLASHKFGIRAPYLSAALLLMTTIIAESVLWKMRMPAFIPRRCNRN